MISQATGHPNIAAQFVLPFVVLVVLRLGRPDGWDVRRGLVLAGLVVVQVFINEELLLFTALALGVFLGMIFPVASLPDWLRPLTLVVPARWFILISRGIMLKGAGVAQLWLPLLVLAGMLIVLMLVAIRSFKPRLA